MYWIEYGILVYSQTNKQKLIQLSNIYIEERFRKCPYNHYTMQYNRMDPV